MTQDRVWLSSYPEGVPADIDPDQYPSLVAMLEESFARFGSRTAFSFMGKDLSYAQMDEQSRQLAAYFQSLGLAKGERIAIMMPNVPQYPVTVAAILRAGYVVVNVNPLYTARELEHQLRDSGAEAIVILENFCHTLEEVIDHCPVRHVVVASMGDLLGFWYGRWISFAVRHLAKMVPAYRLPLSGPLGARQVVSFRQALAEGGARPLKPSQATPDSVAFLQYTGGTTGLSKGAVLTHRNVIAAILQAE
ncbi:MAG: hypothetical protein RIQ97_2024, partial [Pseudomonadota bacterium]